MKYLDNFKENIVGSDEVGVGDYFGPLVVASVKIKKEKLDDVLKIGIKDSKMLTNHQINDMAKKLMNIVDYTIRWLDPYPYNKIYAKYNNFNILKVILHNQSQLKFKGDGIIHLIDGFASKQNYDKYLDKLEVDEEKIYDVILEQKAESKYIQVAAAAIIARKKFNDWFLNQNKKYGDIPFGANQYVKDKIKWIKKNYGEKDLIMLTKLHFKI